jgi:Cof subfamily protein (haloacid dehalogenase superfamily)
VVRLIRLVASDLDGTLLRSDGTVSPRTVRALHAAEAAGLAVVFVTGRPPRWLGDVAAATGHAGLAICNNGALVYDLHSEQVVESFAISVAVVTEVIATLRRAIPGVQFAAEYPSGYREETEDGALVDSPVAKLLVRSADQDSDALLAAAREVLGATVEATHSTHGPHGLLEISAAGVTKATTLARFAEERGLGAEDVLAVGDMPNDLPMLAWAGTAYAVANAHPDVLAAVPRRTAANDDDGVALLVEQQVEMRTRASSGPL